MEPLRHDQSYFLLENALARFRYLHLGRPSSPYVAAKLILADVWHPPIIVSLAVVVGTLAVAALASSLFARPARPTR